MTEHNNTTTDAQSKRVQEIFQQVMNNNPRMNPDEAYEYAQGIVQLQHDKAQERVESGKHQERA